MAGLEDGMTHFVKLGLICVKIQISQGGIRGLKNILLSMRFWICLRRFSLWRSVRCGLRLCLFTELFGLHKSMHNLRADSSVVGDILQGATKINL